MLRIVGGPQAASLSGREELSRLRRRLPKLLVQPEALVGRMAAGAGLGRDEATGRRRSAGLEQLACEFTGTVQPDDSGFALA